jgi:hypothetical protein
LLGETERRILSLLVKRPELSPKQMEEDLGEEIAESATTSLAALLDLGLVVRDDDGRFEIASDFLRRWLVEGADTRVR